MIKNWKEKRYKDIKVEEPVKLSANDITTYLLDEIGGGDLTDILCEVLASMPTEEYNKVKEFINAP